MTTATMERPATITDRCDRCGARSYVMTRTVAGSTFTWCGHHARAVGTSAGEIVVDIRDQLTVRETAAH